jgi:vitamin-K-epoxide reductase (warfarin-sensitive)
VSRSERILFVLIAILSLAGVIDSGIALQRHYSKSATTFCDFSRSFDCDIVNRSEYSTLMGIPVAGIGMAGYAVLFLLSTFWKSRPEAPDRLLGTAFAGLAYASYLTYIEAYELMTWCILCLISLGLIFLIAVSSVILKVRSAKA